MNLVVSDSYRISSDQYQWIIQKRRQRKRHGRRIGEWESESYYPTLESAVAQLEERMVRESEVNMVVDALSAINDVSTTLSQALTRALEENQASIEADEDER